jgi:hypothetical protein
LIRSWGFNYYVANCNMANSSRFSFHNWNLQTPLWRALMYTISMCLKDVFQGARGPNHYLLCSCFYVLGLYACLHRDKLIWNETYPHKLVAAWMNILLTFYFIGFVSWMVTISWLSLTIASKNATIIQDIDLHNNFH